MDEIKLRLADEYNTLDEKIAKLEKFILTGYKADLSEETQNLLFMQFDVMKTYARILNRRLVIWDN